MMFNPFRIYMDISDNFRYQLGQFIKGMTGGLFGWNIKVRIYRNTVNGYQEMEDSGKIVKNGKGRNFKRFLRIRHEKEKIPLPPHEQFLITDRGKRRLLLYSPSPSNYFVIKPSFDNPSLTPIPEDKLLWNALEQERIQTRFQQKSMLEKFMPIILIGITVISVLIVMQGTSMQVASMLAPLQSLGANLAAAANDLSSASQSIQGFTVPTG